MESVLSTDLPLFREQAVCSSSCIEQVGEQTCDAFMLDDHCSSRSFSPDINPDTKWFQDSDVADAALGWLEGHVNLVDFLGADKESYISQNNVLSDLLEANDVELLDACIPNTDITCDAGIHTANLLQILAENMDQDMGNISFKEIQSTANQSHYLSAEEVASNQAPEFHLKNSECILPSSAHSQANSHGSTKIGSFEDSPTVSVLNVESSSCSVSSIKYINEDLLQYPVQSIDTKTCDSYNGMLLNVKSKRKSAQRLQHNLSKDDVLTPKCKMRQPRPYERPGKPGKPGLSKKLIQEERMRRKKQANKDAAARYRQKKKNEAYNVDHICTELEARNIELHERVDSMRKEIQYLKELLEVRTKN